MENSLWVNRFYVYVWWDDGVPFYVGKGHRYRDVSLKNRNPHFKHKLAKMQREGREPTITRICEGVDEEYAFLVEVEAIARWGRRINGGLLVNLTDGGDGVTGHVHSQEAREKLRLSHLGYKPSPEHREKLRLAAADPVNKEKRRQASIVKITGIKRSAETKEKMSKARRGKKLSPEHVEKLRQSNNNFGRKHSYEHVEKVRLANTGKKRSPEIVEKMRLINRGRKASPETKEKLRQVHLGKKKSPEAVEKTRQANIGKQVSEEARERLRQANIGKKHSIETKEKMRLAKLGVKKSAETRERMRYAQGKPKTIDGTTVYMSGRCFLVFLGKANLVSVTQIADLLRRTKSKLRNVQVRG